MPGLLLVVVGMAGVVELAAVAVVPGAPLDSHSKSMAPASPELVQALLLLFIDVFIV